MRVGEYIHYRYSNYQKHGLSVNSDTKPNPMAAFTQQRKKILSSVRQFGQASAGLKQNLERQLNLFFPVESGDQLIGMDFTETELTKMQNTMYKIMDAALISEKGETAMSQILTNYFNLTATGVTPVELTDNELRNELHLLNKTHIGREGQSFTTKQAIARRIDYLIGVRNSIASNPNNSDFINKVQALEAEYKQILATIDPSKSRMYLNNTNTNFIQQLNMLMNQTKSIANTQITGYMGEFAPIITEYVLKQVAQQGVAEIDAVLAQFEQQGYDKTWDIIKGKSLKGQQRSRKVLLKDKIAVGRHGNSAIEAEIADINVKVTPTYDKVDIVLDTQEAGIVSASVKNVSLFENKNISIHSGRSFLEMLQDYPTFTNHYLNISAHSSSAGADSKLLMQAHDTLRLTIALHALTGKQWAEICENIVETPQADLFIVNNSSTSGIIKKGYSVYFMSDILNQIQKNIDLISIEGYDNGPVAYDNDWEGTMYVNNRSHAYRRIAKILAQLHAAKLNVSLNSQALT